MWNGNNVWLHYIKNIIAADVPSAVFLATYLKHASISKHYVGALEIADIQRYKMIKKADKVKIALKDRMDLPFVFVVGKN